MIANKFDYTAPATLAEALALIEQGGKPLAGGMSLVPMMKLRLAIPEHVVDLTRIPALNEIRQDGDRIHIGALATHYEIESSALIRAKCPLLNYAASAIGDVQVRNMGTIGGSTAHADPAADYPASLFALEAEFQLASKGGERTVGVEDFFVDTFLTALEPGELIKEIVVPAEASDTGVAYEKMAHPASGYAVVGIAARIRMKDGKVTLARIGVTGVAGKAFRAKGAEDVLTGSAGDEAAIRAAAAKIGEGEEANSDLFASAAFRKHLAQVYGARALRAAVARAS